MNPLPYFSTVMRSLTRLLMWVGCFLLIGAGSFLRALDEPTSYVLNLPVQADQTLPSWLGHPETPPADFARLEVPILVPDPNASLLVTVFFQEKEGGLMRIGWQGTQGAQTLSENFYEGIGMANQRSLLISPRTLAGDGTLTFQCGDSTLGIQRIKLEWLTNTDSLVSPEIKDLLVTASSGITQPSENLDGQPKSAGSGAWQKQIVTVPVIDQPQRIEDGVEFSVQLDQVPAAARLALAEAGLPWGKRLVVWINEQRAGTITPKVPDLLDEGFPDDAASPYVGWRDGSFYAPVSLLKVGVNTILFSVEDEAPPTTAATTPQTGADAPLAIKDFILQFNYPVPPPSAPATDANPAATAPVEANDLTGPLPTSPSSTQTASP